jgi:hypothetical protein
LAENSLFQQEIDSQSSPVVRIAHVSHVPSKPEQFLYTPDQLQVHATFSSMSSYPSLACSTSGSVKRHVVLLLHFNLIWKFLLQRTSRVTHLSSKTPSSDVSIYIPESPEPNQSRSCFTLSSSTSTSADQRTLSASRIVDYLKNHTASHVKPRHFSARESERILAQRISYIQAVDKILRE